MQVFSFIKQGIELRPVEIEVSLLRGLPQFQIMGLPDAMIKESQLRIKSALKHQGFSLPNSHQILIHLRPPYLKKTSRGLDLAIALAILLKTKQIQLPEDLWHKEKLYAYGELGLEGQVYMPDDLDTLLCLDPQQPIISGLPQDKVDYPIYAISVLQEVSHAQLFQPQSQKDNMTPPDLPDLKFSKQAAELIAVVAAGEHPTLLAGPSGTGKTTLLEAIYAVLSAPEEALFYESRKISKLFGPPVSWRPFVRPHHTIPPLSMIGGGSPPFPGEITRAHGGVLALDEFLEFKPAVQESLREPMETGRITVSRRGRVQDYPARFLLLATTNLCPCGDYVPGKSTGCRFSLTRCRSYLERLSGPVLDRFSILAFSHLWRQKSSKTVSLREVKRQVESAVSFRKQKRGQQIPNQQLSSKTLEEDLDDFLRDVHFLSDISSRRRVQSILRVARTVADLEQEEKVGLAHLEKAKFFAMSPFLDLYRMG